MKNKRWIHTAFLYLLISFLVNGTLRAQTVTTDYNTCMQGVKDSTGKWIIEPMYEDMRYDRFGYLVSLGGKYGLIDKKGNTRLPVIYQYVEALYSWSWASDVPYGYYLVRLNGSEGVVDTNNHAVVPIEYLDVRVASDSIIPALGRDGYWYFFNLQGASFRTPWKTEHYPDQIAPHRYKADRRTLFHKRYGIISDSGDVILPCEYSYIEYQWGTKTVTVYKKGKYGICSMAGSFLWPVKLKYTGTSLYSSDLRLLTTNGLGPAFDGKKYGLVNLSGDTLLPFAYDRISLFDNYTRQATGNLWVVMKDSLSGIYNDETGWILPMDCEELMDVSSYHTREDSICIGLLVYKRNNHWGAKTTSGQVVLPCEYNGLRNEGSSEYIFSKGDSMILLGINKRRNINSLMIKAGTYAVPQRFDYFRDVVRFIPFNQQFSVFHGKENIKAWYNPEDTHDSLYNNGQAYLFDTGNYYAFNLPDSIITSAAFYVQPVTQPVLETPEVRAFHLDHIWMHDSAYPYPDLVLFLHNRFQQYASVSGRFQKPGVDYFKTANGDAFTEDGHVLLSSDSIEQVEFRRHAVGQELFIEAMNTRHEWSAYDTLGKLIARFGTAIPGEFNEHYAWKLSMKKPYGWILTDIAGKNLLGKKIRSVDDFPIWDSITIVDERNVGRRLFNAKSGKFLTSFGFNHIQPVTLNASAFAVKTCTGHIGVIGADGKWITDTLWTSYMPLIKDTALEYMQIGTDGFDNDYSRFLVFSNKQTASVFETSSLTMHPVADYYGLLWKLLCHPLPGASFDTLLRDSLFSKQTNLGVGYYFPAADSLHYLPWHRQCILDTLCAGQRMRDNLNYFGYNNCAYCYHHAYFYSRFAWTRNSETGGIFSPGYTGDSILSFCKVAWYWQYEEYYTEKTFFSNTALFPDGLRVLTIDSLFNSQSDWKNFLVNTVLNFVNTHNNVRGDCHNPAGIPQMLSNEFLITPAGVEIFPPGFTVNRNQLMILLTWQDLDPYLRTDMRSRLPLNDKK